MPGNLAVQFSSLFAAAGVTPLGELDRRPGTAAHGARVGDRLMEASADPSEADGHVIFILLNELNHRVKNTLSTVHSIAAQTMRGATDGDAAFTRFESRLIALSEVQNLLTVENWRGARVGEVVERSMAPFGPAVSERVTISGPAVWLPTQAAIALSLALHELAANALHFGALSTPAGRVEILWTHERTTGRFEFTWTEIGGPPVGPPARKGYGTRLIERGLRAEFGGEASLNFEPAGVVCRVSAVLRKPRPSAAVRERGSDDRQ
jgi:two-component sensor histidine kinase